MVLLLIKQSATKEGSPQLVVLSVLDPVGGDVVDIMFDMSKIYTQLTESELSTTDVQYGC